MRGLVTPVPTCEAGVRSRLGTDVAVLVAHSSVARAGSVWPGARANKRLWYGLVGYGGSPEEAREFLAVAENPLPAPTPRWAKHVCSRRQARRTPEAKPSRTHDPPPR
jgi:hypothetical protein